MKSPDDHKRKVSSYHQLKKVHWIIAALARTYTHMAMDTSEEYVNTYFDFSHAARQKRKLLNAKIELYESAKQICNNVGTRIEIVKNDEEESLLHEQMIYVIYLMIAQFKQLDQINKLNNLSIQHRKIIEKSDDANSEEPYMFINISRKSNEKNSSLKTAPFSSLDYLIKAWSTIISGFITIGIGGGCMGIACSPSIEKDPMIRHSDRNGSILLMVTGLLTIALGVCVLYQEEYENIQEDLSTFEKTARHYSELQTNS